MGAVRSVFWMWLYVCKCLCMSKCMHMCMYVYAHVPTRMIGDDCASQLISYYSPTPSAKVTKTMYASFAD